MSVDIYARRHQQGRRSSGSDRSLQRGKLSRRQHRHRRRGFITLSSSSARSSRDEGDASSSGRKSSLTKNGRKSSQESKKPASTKNSGEAPPNFRLLELQASFKKNQARIRSLQSDILQLKESEEHHLNELNAILINLKKRLDVGEVAASNAHGKLRESHVKRVRKIESEFSDKLEKQVERSWKNHATYVGRTCDSIREEIDMIDNAQRRMLIQASTKGVQWLLIGVRTVVSPLVRLLHCCGCRNTSHLSSYMDIEDYGVTLD